MKTAGVAPGCDAKVISLWKGDERKLSTSDFDLSVQKNQLTLLRPRAGTVAANILTVLESSQSLTAGAAWRNHGCARLAAVKRLGWPIVAATVEVTCADGRIAHVASYSMGRGASFE